jgi:diaminopimelate epimerase
MKNNFFKGHGLGNDYIALDPAKLSFKLTPKTIRALCDRNWGIGSDGILALVPSKKANFGLRIFNPDGSEAEKSGNGLRIFGCYLYHTKHTRKKHLTVETKGGLVEIHLELNGHGCRAIPSIYGSQRGQSTLRGLQKKGGTLDP